MADDFTYDHNGSPITITYTDNGNSITINNYPPSVTGVVDIPDTIAGKPVIGIGASAFALCENMTSVMIPETVTSIGSSAFLLCRRMTSAPIPEAVENLGEQVFANCSVLSQMNMGGFLFPLNR